MTDVMDGPPVQMVDPQVEIRRLNEQVGLLTRQLEARTTQNTTLVGQLETLQRELLGWGRKWERTWDRLNAEAEHRGWCDDYDRICEELGGIPRTREVSVSVEANVATSVGDMNDEYLRRAMGIPSGVEYSVSGSVDWTVTVSDTVTVTAGSCGCDEVDQEELVTNWLDNNGISYDEVDVNGASCDNCS